MSICTRCVQLEAELETARELAFEAVQARDIGRAALMLMEQQLAEWKAGVVAANRISQAMEARAVKAEALQDYQDLGAALADAPKETP